jgi:hypothetical protein
MEIYASYFSAFSDFETQFLCNYTRLISVHLVTLELNFYVMIRVLF